MKIEKAFTIDGEVVIKEFQKGNISVYSKGDSIEMIIYFVNSNTGEIMFKQSIAADMGQGTGYISEMTFQGVN